MLQTTIEEFDIQVGERFRVTFQRTLRLPDDGREYPLPPGLGAFPVHRAADFPKVPEEWRRNGDAFIPLYQSEALWLGFNAASWKPNAVQVGVGNINAVSGGEVERESHGEAAGLPRLSRAALAGWNQCGRGASPAVCGDAGGVGVHGGGAIGGRGRGWGSANHRV